MKSRDFVFWLTGYLEAVAGAEGSKLDVSHLDAVKSRLAGLFINVANRPHAATGELAAAIEKGRPLEFKEIANRFLAGTVIVQED